MIVWLKKLFFVFVPSLLKLLSRVLVKEHGKDNSFLIPGYTGLGNFVLKTPFVKILREQYPDARIDILCGNSYGVEFVLTDSSWINEILVFPATSGFLEQIKFYLRIRGQYSTIFLFFDTFIPHLYYGSIIAGIQHRIGHSDLGDDRDTFRNSCLTHSVPMRRNAHEVDVNIDLLEVIFKPNRVYTQYVSTPQSYSSEVKNLIKQFSIKNGNYILLQLSAANGAPTTKTWPADHFRGLISLLMDKGHALIAVGDSGEKDIADYILEPFDNKVLNLVGKTSLPDIVLLIKNARGLLCHDSGLMHIGNALEVPLIAIGSGDYAKTRPLAVSSHVIRLDFPCAPCLGINGYWGEAEAVDKCPNNIRCMSEITSEMVFEKVLDVF